MNHDTNNARSGGPTTSVTGKTGPIHAMRTLLT